MFLTLNEALKELFEEGIENRIKRYQEDARVIRKGLEALNLAFLLKDENYMSNTVTSVFLPVELNLYDFIDQLDNRGYVVYLGKGPLLKKNMFQVANMGRIYPEDCQAFLKTLRGVLKGFS